MSGLDSDAGQSNLSCLTECTFIDQHVRAVRLYALLLISMSAVNSDAEWTNLSCQTGG